ncbi:MAG TPA: STAS/SEC14 domain-containing protein [Fodinibius sp.]|nr:STAS/SEC14 domain-containing protein [Fodinibius sp.]
MLTFIDIEADNVVGIRVDGKISGQEFDAVAALLEKKMKDHSKVRIYAELAPWKGITLEALMKDLRFGLSNWKRFDKEAVVTEKKWIKRWAEIGDKMIGSIEVKAFPFEKKEEAKQWIQE